MIEQIRGVTPKTIRRLLDDQNPDPLVALVSFERYASNLAHLEVSDVTTVAEKAVFTADQRKIARNYMEEGVRNHEGPSPMASESAARKYRELVTYFSN